MCILNFEEIVKRGLRIGNKYWDKYNSRHRSWEYCRGYFWDTYSKQKPIDKELLCLNLAFYLTSWGMYRGSSALLFNDYQVHKDIIDILFDKNYDNLWNYNPFNDWQLNALNNTTIFNKNGKIWAVYNEMHQKTNYPRKKSGKPEASATLISKVLLGTWGCVPAYDTFFKKGVEYFGLSSDFTQKGLQQIISFLKVCPEVRRVISTYNKYTPMKIIDAYFWQLGFELSLLELLNKNPDKKDYVANIFYDDEGGKAQVKDATDLIEKIQSTHPIKNKKCNCDKYVEDK